MEQETPPSGSEVGAILLIAGSLVIGLIALLAPKFCLNSKWGFWKKLAMLLDGLSEGAQVLVVRGMGLLLVGVGMFVAVGRYVINR
jgi:hypothetical protein